MEDYLRLFKDGRIWIQQPPWRAPDREQAGTSAFDPPRFFSKTQDGTAITPIPDDAAPCLRRHRRNHRPGLKQKSAACLPC
jgi:hypothetical protein